MSFYDSEYRWVKLHKDNGFNALRMPHATNHVVNTDIPYVTHSDDERYITNIKEGTRIVSKYFAFNAPVCLTLCCRSAGKRAFEVLTGEIQQRCIDLPKSDIWNECSLNISETGIFSLELWMTGGGIALRQFIHMS